ncbi:hypothetical protein KAFR_0H02860 [Kazachstania africana CBS 2517]|uniref:SEC7 domain-containing protein n=1 Tax=Kazachstania africana (strain ATCC 22294 / BCRC 22015 / CBS 2517 / CECT 1963 / NBRC 1671 / NRRL Y-8276) TaxID=1071382 RepID=H2AZD9_KAZAF|nr:hypothetical protein KAFR_0H02860 [Kazachstania africana CBS 2517]CCF59695.1 hypothetical protein KAFR_0H02860 [Kazachstania africana CBS 2517]
MIHKKVGAVDPVTIVIKECINLSTAMRKYSKFTSQSGVAALLGGGSDIFSNQDDGLATTFNNLSSTKYNDPFLSGFIQLRLMLNKLNDLNGIDSLTLLQPFLLIISTSSISGYITSLALDSLQKFFSLNIISASSKNYVVAYREAVNALTHCRFEGSQQTSDDSVLLKVVLLLDTIINSQYGDHLSDSTMYDVVQTIMSLACNKRRTEVLRKAAEATMVSITVKIFSKLEELEPINTTQKYINDESYSTNVLKADTIGTSASSDSQSILVDESVHSLSDEDREHDTNEKDQEPIESEPQKTTEQEIQKQEVEVSNSLDPDYGLPVIKQYLTLLLSLIVPENQAKHTNSTRIFGLQLINTAIELCGDRFPLYPRLFSLVSDPIFKCVLYIIQNTDKLSLLQAALQLFTTLVINLGNHLPMQIELTLSRIFSILLDDSTSHSKKSSNVNSRDNKSKPAVLKELLIEQISILWTRSPSFFTSTFTNFDCNLDRADLSINFLKALTRLALPESALDSTESVPPICLEGLVSLIDDMYEHMQRVDRNEYLKKNSTNDNEILKQRELKTEFIKCAKVFNEKPKKGIPMLVEKGFIKSESDEDIANFLFENNSRMNKKTIGLLLCDPKRELLLKKFINLFDFKDLRVDEAVRILLTKFRLPGESQQIERIIEAFSISYVESQDYSSGNEEETEEEPVQPDSDSVFVLSYSIIMLNTDLHNPQVREHMSFEDYSNNLKGCNNQKDYPFWYLDRIYCSIRDKEIVMPEEHHGNDRWFEDAWNNLISSTTVITEIRKDNVNVIDSLTSVELLRFDRAIFKHIGSSIVNTFFKIYIVATDDHIMSRMLTSLDRCAFIAAFFNFKKLFNDILTSIAKLTTLLPASSYVTGAPGSEATEEENAESNASVQPTVERGYIDIDTIPLVEITMEDSKQKIPVSTQAVRLGKSFKAQLCTVILFRIIQRTNDPSIMGLEFMSDIVKILLSLFENLLISPDIFPDLQQRLKIGNLPRPLPEITITKNNENKGLLSTFASYLKGDEEPSDEEIDSSIKALDCIASSKATSSIFGNVNIITPTLVRLLITSINVNKTAENSRFFEAEILFIIEISVALLLVKNDKELSLVVLEKLCELTEMTGVTKRTIRRLVTYKLLLISVIKGQEEKLHYFINEELLLKNEIFNQKFFALEQGMELISILLSLTEIPNYSEYVLKDEGFWKVLRMIASMPEHTQEIYDYLNKRIIGDNNNLLSNENFMFVLGLLDEISSIGAIGSKWEQDYNNSVKSGHKISNENPYQPIVEISLKSINSTARLISSSTLTKNQIIAIIQALAHQCINPCEQIRSYALVSLEDALTEKIRLPNAEITTLEDLIENGLVTLLNASDRNKKDNMSISDILQVISKVYLYHLREGITTNDTFLKILGIFNAYVEIPEVENELQQVIIEKKKIEKTFNETESSHDQETVDQIQD